MSEFDFESYNEWFDRNHAVVGHGARLAQLMRDYNNWRDNRTKKIANDCVEAHRLGFHTMHEWASIADAPTKSDVRDMIDKAVAKVRFSCAKNYTTEFAVRGIVREELAKVTRTSTTTMNWRDAEPTDKSWMPNPGGPYTESKKGQGGSDSGDMGKPEQPEHDSSRKAATIKLDGVYVKPGDILLFNQPHNRGTIKIVALHLSTRQGFLHCAFYDRETDTPHTEDFWMEPLRTLKNEKILGVTFDLE